MSTSRFFGVLLLGLVAISVKWFVKDSPQGVPVQPRNDVLVPGLPTLQFPGLSSEHLEVVFVLDPNFHLCWEHVPVNDWTRATLLPWVKGLKDFFAEDDDLEVPDRNHRATELQGMPHKSFRQLVNDVMENGNETVTLPSNLVLMYQAATSNSTFGELGLLEQTHSLAHVPINLTLDRVHVTSVYKFWDSALQAYIASQVSQQDSAEKNIRVSPVATELPDLSNTVLLLPRLVSRLHDSSAEYTCGQNPLAWDVPLVLRQVQALINHTGVSTLPALEEWAVLADKRQLHGMYQEYFEADPKHRTAPTPTVFLKTPGTPEELLALCYNEVVISSEAHLDANMEVIYDGLLRLKEEMRKLGRHGADVSRISGARVLEDGEQLWQFILKREFAEGAVVMTSFEFPARALQHKNSTQKYERGEEPWRAKPSLPAGAPPQLQQSDVLTTVPHLHKAAQLMGSKSCGEGWLLQPRIMDMPDLEYRVYLMGGAAATGSPEDMAVVYTPAVLDDGIYMANLTLPPGHFWSDVIEPPGRGLERLEAGTAEGEGMHFTDKLGQKRTPWHCPELYQKIVYAALSGARAMGAHGNGTLATVSRMFVRVDVVLGVYWDDAGENMFVQPLINEMDWFNSASQMIAHWPLDDSPEGFRKSWGYRLGQPLLREIALRFDETRTLSC